MERYGYMICDHWLLQRIVCLWKSLTNSTIEEDPGASIRQPTEEGCSALSMKGLRIDESHEEIDLPTTTACPG